MSRYQPLLAAVDIVEDILSKYMTVFWTMSWALTNLSDNIVAIHNYWDDWLANRTTYPMKVLSCDLSLRHGRLIFLPDEPGWPSGWWV